MSKYRPSTSVTTATYFDIAVYGRLWCGAKCNHSYQRKTAPKTAAQVKSIAGDFQTIEQFTVAKVTRTTKTTAQILLTERD